MRHEPVPIGSVVLELLARADTLALWISEAIAAEDDARLGALLDDREAILAALASVMRGSPAEPLSAADRGAIDRALAHSAAVGNRVHALAQETREQIGAELASLGARQQAGLEYQAAGGEHAIDVVL
jgi:hypothetical protein